MVAWDVALLYGGFMTSCLLLGCKSHMTLITLILSRVFIKGANAPAPEDKAYFEKLKRKETSDYKPIEGLIHPDVKINAILVNENQSFTMFLLFGVAFMAMAEFSRGHVLYTVNAVVGTVLFMSYVLVRYIWFFWYMTSIQPWRTITFVLSFTIQGLIGLYAFVVFIISIALY